MTIDAVVCKAIAEGVTLTVGHDDGRIVITARLEANDRLYSAALSLGKLAYVQSLVGESGVIAANMLRLVEALTEEREKGIRDDRISGDVADGH